MTKKETVINLPELVPNGTLLGDILSVPREEWPITIKIANPAEKQTFFSRLVITSTKIPQ